MSDQEMLTEIDGLMLADAFPLEIVLWQYWLERLRLACLHHGSGRTSLPSKLGLNLY